jgi:hypothetical protein
VTRAGGEESVSGGRTIYCPNREPDRAHTDTYIRYRHTHTDLGHERQQRRDEEDGDGSIGRRRPVPREVLELVRAEREARAKKHAGVVDEADQAQTFRVALCFAHHDRDRPLPRLRPEEGPGEADEEAEGQGVLDAEALRVCVCVCMRNDRLGFKFS